ncbi:MAG: ABC transporter substrate-binding protein [Chloroflexota bacterium]|nr:ABC transporter substrate-binding protein [Chloroflexota bacterium]
MRNRHIFRFIFVVVIITLGLAACKSSPSQEQEIRIGVIAPITGEIAAVGQSTVNAAEMVAQEVNKAGGLEVDGQRYEITLIIEDNQDKEQAAVAAVQKLINQDNVVAIIGPQASRNAIPASNAAESSHIPMISPWSTNPKTTHGKDYIFRIAFIDSFQGQVMARFTFEELGTHKVAVLYDVASDYNKGIAEIYKQVVEDAGGEVVAFESYTTGEQDFSTQFERIKASGAEVLFLPNYYNEVPQQVRQAREMGITAAVIGSDSWMGIEKADLADLEGSFFSTHYFADTSNEQAKPFIEAYRQIYGQTPDDVAALTYDAFGLLFQAIQSQNDADPESIRTGLSTIDAYSGITGTMKYRGTGDPIKSAVILKITAGDFVFYKQVSP